MVVDYWPLFPFSLSLFAACMRRSTLIWIIVGGFLALCLVGVMLFAAMAIIADDDGFATGSGERIAVIPIEGVIDDGMAKVVNRQLKQYGEDSRIKAIVLRIDSPGGGVSASQEIHREVKRLRDEKKKKIIVSMASVAASGGYYIACAADSVFAEPATITGSIGVFGMIPMLHKTMENKLGITYDTVRTGKFSAFGTPFIEFSPEESQLIQNSVDKIYEDFLLRVAKARNKSRDEVHAIAQGRVWAGLKAKEVGLVDEIGNLDRALAAASKLAGLEKYRTEEYPRTQTGLEQFMDRFTKTKERDNDVKAWMVQNEMGDLYPLYKAVRDMKRNAGIQMRLPYELMVR